MFVVQHDPLDRDQRSNDDLLYLVEEFIYGIHPVFGNEIQFEATNIPFTSGSIVLAGSLLDSNVCEMDI